MVSLPSQAGVWLQVAQLVAVPRHVLHEPKYWFEGYSGTGTVPRPYTLPTSGLSTLFLGFWPVSWHCLGSHKQCCWPISRHHEVCEQLGQRLKLALPRILNDALWWQSLSRPITSGRQLSTQLLGLGRNRDFCLWKPTSVLLPALQCSLTNNSMVKSKGFHWGRWVNKAKVGVEAWNQPQRKENILLNSHRVCWACRHLRKML